MAYITLKGLDFKKIRNWIQKAKHNKNIDPVFSFISAWIGFNYYYSTFASAHEKEFISWAKKYFNGKKGDRSKWSFLVSHDKFKTIFNRFRESNTTIFEKEVHLPVKNMIGGNSVPKDLKGVYKLKKLDVEPIFSTIYQIRNNLFHGNKNPDKDKRDKELSIFACQFMVPFLTYLIKNTQG